MEDPNFTTMQDYLKNDQIFKEHVSNKGYEPEILPLDDLLAYNVTSLLYNYQNRHREEVQIDLEELLLKLYKKGYLTALVSDASNLCSKKEIDDDDLEQRMIERPTETVPMFKPQNFKRNAALNQCKKHYEGLKYFFKHQFYKVRVGSSSNSEEDFDRPKMAELIFFILYKLEKFCYKQNQKSGAASEDDKYYRRASAVEQKEAITKAIRDLKVTEDSQGNVVKLGKYKFEECDPLVLSSLKTALGDYLIKEYLLRIEKSRASEPVRLRPRVTRPGVMHLITDKSVTTSPMVSQETMKDHVKRMYVVKTSVDDLGTLDFFIDDNDIKALDAIPDVRKWNHKDILYQCDKIRCGIMETYTDRMKKSPLFKRKRILGKHKCLVKVVGGKIQKKRIPVKFSIETKDGEVLKEGTVKWQQIAACYDPKNPLNVQERIHEQDPNKYITDSSEPKDVIIYESSHECKFAGCCCFLDINYVPKIINAHWKNDCFMGEGCKCPTACLNIRTLVQYYNRKLKYGAVIQPETMVCQPCTTAEQ